MVHRKQLKRIEANNHARYLTCSCYHRLPLLNNVPIKQLLVAQLHLTSHRLGFSLFAWVVMPEHFHLLILPDLSQAEVPRILAAIKRPVAARVLKRWRKLNAKILSQLTDTSGRVHFWQPGGGYDRNIISQAELEEKIDYIHHNPVRRGLANCPADWPWSSAGPFLNQSPEE